MGPRGAACALLFACCFAASTALSPSSGAPRSRQQSDRIPKNIWVTGQWKADSQEVKDQIAKNIGDQTVEHRTEIFRAQIQAYYAKWVPIGSNIRYLTDEDMDDSVRKISMLLAAKGITDVDKAYFNLRPGAFRADVWRLMQLWAEGGVYLDANINLTHELTYWIDFSNDELVVVRDTGVKDGIWNAMMAAEQGNQYLQNALADITSHILTHYYGTNPLAITGPIALGSSFMKDHRYPNGLRRELEWKGGKVNNTKTAEVVAQKDEKLHDKDPSKHYDPMWRHHQVYCDQKGPTPDNGKCPEGSWKNADGSVKYVDHVVHHSTVASHAGHQVASHGYETRRRRFTRHMTTR